jgi:metal transporter CNNM
MFDLVVILFLIALSACFSGLTLGYFTLNLQTLRRKAKLGDHAAAKIIPIRRQGNLLLTTLLFGNVAVNSILSVFLSSLATGVIAATVATTLIFLFGEIIPQAAFSRHAMWVGEKAAPFVRVLMVLLYPVTFPIAYMLDRVLGAEMHTLYSKGELMAIVSELEDSEHSPIDADEERIIHGALQFSHMTVREVMTPKEQVALFDENDRLDRELIKELGDHAYSRYPVYSGNPDNIVGILYVKDLLGEDPDIALKHTEDAFDRSYLSVRPDQRLDAVLALMLKKRQHLAIVETKNKQFLGVISLEDIIEEIIQVEIEDEDDDELLS